LKIDLKKANLSKGRDAKLTDLRFKNKGGRVARV
jgi:hypothetical protein